MNAVAKIGPIAISVDASTRHGYSSGIFNGCNQVNPDINHAVVLIGINEWIKNCEICKKNFDNLERIQLYCSTYFYIQQIQEDSESDLLML